MFEAYFPLFSLKNTLPPLRKLKVKAIFCRNLQVKNIQSFPPKGTICETNLKREGFKFVYRAFIITLNSYAPMAGNTLCWKCATQNYYFKVIFFILINIHRYYLMLTNTNLSGLINYSVCIFFLANFG